MSGVQRNGQQDSGLMMRQEGVAGPRTRDLADGGLAHQAHPGMNHGDVIRQPPYLHPHQSQGGAVEDVLEAVRAGLADGLAVVPPEPGHVHELRVRVEDRGQLVRVPVVPRLDEHRGYALRAIEWAALRVYHHRSGHLPSANLGIDPIGAPFLYPYLRRWRGWRVMPAPLAGEAHREISHR